MFQTKSCAWFLAVACIGLLACGSDPAPKCISGATQPCTCASGASGAQTCGASGSFGTCDCGDPTDGGVIDHLTDLLDGTVRDTTTSLVWQQSFSPATQDQAASVAYCESLTLAGGGWRLPTDHELFSISDRRFTPTIDLSFFPGTLAESFWSSSPGWYLDFADGSLATYGGGIPTPYRARCVR